MHNSEPTNLNYQMTLANEYQAVGQFEQAIHIYSELLQDIPDDSGVLIMQGHAFKTVGDTEKAIGAYQKASLAKDKFGDAFWSLANLKTYQFSDEEITHMQGRESVDDIPFEDRFNLCFAIGKALEDKQAYDESFIYYERGNALKRKQLGYQSERVTAEVNAQIEVCTKHLFEIKAHCGSSASDPIFIVGLPRAGSTLLEQILSSHSMVDGTMELPNIMALAHRLNGRRNVQDAKPYPKILETLDAEQLKGFGDAFIRDTQMHRKGAPFLSIRCQITSGI